MKLSTALKNLWRFRDRSALDQVKEVLADKIAARLPRLVRRQVVVQATNTALRRSDLMSPTAEVPAVLETLGYKEIYEGSIA